MRPVVSDGALRYWHRAWTARDFAVPPHGSPNVALEAPTEQLDMPTHAAETTDCDVEALQLDVAYEPHAPVDVP